MGKVSLLGICIFIILFSSVAADAISIENLKKFDVPEKDFWDPVLSPDGTKIAYVAYDEAYLQQIFAINPDGTGEKKLTSDAFKKWGLSWGTDKIAYVSLGKDGLEKIYVMNPDGTENRQLILDNTRQGSSAWSAPSWSPDGRLLIYTSRDEKEDPKLYMVNSDGTGKKLVLEGAFRQWSPSFSPDGKNIVYVSYNERYKEELFITDISGNSRRQLTFDEIKKNNPVWGPDGTITYVSYETITSSGEKIFSINQDGTGRKLFVDSDFKQLSPSFSLDGRKFSYAAIDLTGMVKLGVGDVAGAVSASPSPTPETTMTQPAHTTPVVEKESAGTGDVLWTMFIILAVVVAALLIILVIADFMGKK